MLCEFVGEASKEPLNIICWRQALCLILDAHSGGGAGPVWRGDSRVWAEQLHSLLWAQVTPGQVGAVS